MGSNTLRIQIAWVALVVAGLLAIYLPSLGNGLVFDDEILANGYLFGQFGSLGLRPRAFSYGTFVWLHAVFGDGWWKQRLVNVLLHGGVVAALWGFWREMLRHVQPATVLPGEAPPDPASAPAALALSIGVFALNPVAVYAVAYLIQRSILMATLFVVLALWAFARGVATRSPLMLALALGSYALAIVSKEYAILAPLAAIPVYILAARPAPKRLVLLAAGGAVLVVLVGVALWTRYGEIIGKPFDEYSRVYIAQLGQLDPNAAQHAWGLSILNQAWLFFEYGVRWFLPYAGWMSIDQRPPFPVAWLTFPQCLGLAGYLAVIVGGFYLLLKFRDWRALAGLSLLLPALLFGTEFVTVWVQDPFVLYRSYLWAIGVPGLVWCLAHDAPPRALLAAGVVVAALFTWQGVDRVFSMETPVAAWTDAIEKLPRDPRAVGRWFPYLSRGNEYLDRKDFESALHDFQASSALGDRGMGAMDSGSLLVAAGKPGSALDAFDRAEAQGYDLYNLPFQRGIALAQMQRFPEAYEQFRKALAMDPPSPGREKLLAAMGRLGLQIGKREEAVAALEELVKRDPQDREGRYLLAMAYIQGNRPDRAKPLLDGLLMQQGYGPAYYARAMANYGLGHKADALADIEAALRTAPGNPNLLQWQARIRAMP